MTATETALGGTPLKLKHRYENYIADANHNDGL